MKKLFTVLLSLFSFLGCKKEDPATSAMSTSKQKSEYKVIDDKVIDSGDYFEVIDPVWWKGNIYGTYEEYEASLSSFSYPQRLVFAVVWYESEVNNGGHDQFFTNSTGIVWKDAIEALEIIGGSSRAAILHEAARRIGGSPSFDRDKRIDQVESSGADFEDLDSKFYDLDDDFYDKMESYIKENRKDFYFEGVVTTPDI